MTEFEKVVAEAAAVISRMTPEERRAARQKVLEERALPLKLEAEALVSKDPEFRDDTYAYGVHPDLVFARMEIDGAVLCVKDIKFAWDQWMKCWIKCEHGTFTGVSNSAWFNPMGQSFLEAYQAWVKDPAHQEPQGEEEGTE